MVQVIAGRTPAEPAPARVPVGLTSVDLAEVDFGGHVEERRISGAADELELDDVEVSRSSLSGLRLIGGRLSRCHFTDVRIEDSDLSGVDVSDCRWQRVEVRDSRLAGVSLAGGMIGDGMLDHVRAARLDLRFATVRRTRFQDCDLSGVDFTGATFDRVVFAGCRLHEARFAQLVAKRMSFVDCDASAAVGVAALQGALVDGPTLSSLAGPMAAALGIHLDHGR